MGKDTSGSITLFLALTLTLVLSFCFSLLEAARVQCLQAVAQRRLLLGLESVLGEYHVGLWQDYRLLFLDGSLGEHQLSLPLLEGHMMEESDLGHKGIGFLQMALRDIEVSGYTLATDFHGAAFEIEACNAIKGQLAEDAADGLKEKLREGEEMAAQKPGIADKWEQAKDAAECAEDIQEAEAQEQEAQKQVQKAEEQKQEAQKQVQKAEVQEQGAQKQVQKAEVQEQEAEAQEQEAGMQGQKNERQELPENPMESVEMLKRSAILAAVVGNPSEISGKAIASADSLKSRNKELGSLEEPERGGLDKFWFLQYLNNYLSCYTGAGKHGEKTHALDYELEYCIAGKDTDAKNLERVTKELLLIREVGNFATILQDGKKQALALEMATAAVGFTGLAPLVAAVKLGILLAWSYIESVMDVRSLLAGGAVPLVKKPSDWKSDVSLGRKALEQKPGKSEGQNGWEYREYLLLLLMLCKEHTVVYRAMDVVEQNIRQMPGEEHFRMDCQIYRIRAEGLYVSQPLFLGFVTVGKPAEGMYHFRHSQEISY